jgi:hypothetical protein
VNVFGAVRALSRLGHFAGLTGAALVNALADEGKFSAAVRSFQAFHGLEQTGAVDGPTADRLALPRCGHPDFMADSSAECAWPMKAVTYAQAFAFSGFDTATVAAAYDQAWASWAAVCGVEPAAAVPGGPVNVLGRTGRGAADGFDASNTILALSELPCGVPATAQIHQVFNAAESWTKEMLLAVMAHEIGHALGLPHLPGSNLMNPYYTPGLAVPQPADVAEAVARYGPPAAQPATPPTPPGPGPAVPPAPGGGAVRVRISVPAAGDYDLTITAAPAAD